MIRLSGVRKDFGAGCVVDGISVDLPAGGITSIIGPNGAGKSTLLSMMARLTSIGSGSIQVGGLDVTTTATDVLARRLSILRQHNRTDLRVTVRDLVAFGRFPHSRGRITADDDEHIERSLAFMGLGELSGRFIDELSGGQRQRAFIAMVLCQDTEYVLLDEPLSGLDMRHAVSMMRRLRRAVDELGKTIVIVLHDINHAAAYSDWILGLRDGKVVGHGTPHELITPRNLEDLFGVASSIIDNEGRPFVVLRP